jgi:hypothetical protein
MKVIYAPNKIPTRIDKDCKMIFLAGSIEMGTAEEWQTRVGLYLADKNVILLNPRRLDWDSSWVQSKDNQQFREQVEWELYGLEMAHRILMYFDPETKSPISLLELGLHARSPQKLIVCCPEGFWKKGNVDIVCERYKIPQIKKLTEVRDLF